MSTPLCAQWIAKLCSSVVRRSLSLSCCIAAVLPVSSAMAQTIESTATFEPLPPRWHINYNSASGGRENGVTGVEGFIPLLQTPGHSLGYFVPRVGLDNGADLSGSALAGYRFLSGNTVLGSYAGFDFRNTGQNDFTQFSAGLEAFGENWDIHLNTYLPLGNTRNLAGGNGGTTSTVFPYFQGNQLILETATFSQFEAALAGVDLDIGLKVFDTPSTDESLWIYPGIYYYGGSGSTGSVGGRVSLDYRPQENLRVGPGAQHDGLLGTNVFFSVNASVGGAPRPITTTNAPEDETEGETETLYSQAVLWSRAAERVTRDPSITIENQTALVSQMSAAAVNPATGNTYNFLHVLPNAGNANQGDGTVANPFTTLGSRGGAASTALGTVSPNDIVYVRPGDSLTNAIGRFTLPANIQVLSSGVAHTLPVTTASGTALVTLPNFGDTGTLPIISGNGRRGVSLTGANTVLAGFDVRNASRGIVANNAAGSSIRDNVISRPTGDGLVVLNSPNTTISNNQVVQPGDEGLELANSANSVVSNNQFTQVAERGMLIFSSRDTTVSNNTINQSGEEGIEIDSSPNSLVVGNTVTRATRAGIFVEGLSGIDIRDNTVQQTTTRNATRPAAIYLAGVTGTVNVTGNTVTNTVAPANPSLSGQGIALRNTAGNVSLSLSGNTVGGAGAGNAGDGVVVSLASTATGTVNIDNNQIAANGTAAPQAGDGIQVTVDSAANLSNLTISNNQILNNLDDGIDIRVGSLAAAGAQLRALIVGNTIANHANGQGINIESQSSAINAGVAVNGNSQTAVSIQQNTLSENATDIRAVANGNGPGSTLCLRAQNNTNQDSLNAAAVNGGTLQLEPVTGNTNNASAIAPNVAANTCNTP